MKEECLFRLPKCYSEASSVDSQVSYLKVLL